MLLPLDTNITGLYQEKDSLINHMKYCFLLQKFLSISRPMGEQRGGKQENPFCRLIGGLPPKSLQETSTSEKQDHHYHLNCKRSWLSKRQTYTLVIGLTSITEYIIVH